MLHAFKATAHPRRVFKKTSFAPCSVSDKDQMLSSLCIWWSTATAAAANKSATIRVNFKQILNNTIFISVDALTCVSGRPRTGGNLTFRSELCIEQLCVPDLRLFTSAGAAAAGAPVAVDKHCRRRTS